jgi:hypothetical protein
VWVVERGVVGCGLGLQGVHVDGDPPCHEAAIEGLLDTLFASPVTESTLAVFKAAAQSACEEFKAAQCLTNHTPMCKLPMLARSCLGCMLWFLLLVLPSLCIHAFLQILLGMLGSFVFGQAVAPPSKKRNISLKLGGLDIIIPVSDPASEWHMRMQARVKSMALGRPGGLPMLDFEAWVMPDPPSGNCEVPDWLMPGMAEARSLAAEMLQDSGIECFADMAKILVGNSDSLVSLDSSFKLELAWLSTTAPECMVQATRRHILGCLASESQQSTLKQSIQRLSDFLKSRFVQHMTYETQGLVRGCIDILSKITKGTPPNMGIAKTSAFFNQFFELLPFFCTYSLKEGDRTKELKGKDALDRQVADLKAAMDKKEKVKLSDIDVVEGFSWLLDEGQKTLVSAAKKSSLLAGATASAVDKASSSSKSSSKGKDKAASVLSYFG